MSFALRLAACRAPRAGQVGGGSRLSSSSSTGGLHLLGLRRPASPAISCAGASAVRPRAAAVQPAPRRSLSLSLRVNSEISASLVRVVDMSGNELGVLRLADALAEARGE
jgi:hypothetical protein